MGFGLLCQKSFAEWYYNLLKPLLLAMSTLSSVLWSWPCVYQGVMSCPVTQNPLHTPSLPNIPLFGVMGDNHSTLLPCWSMQPTAATINERSMVWLHCGQNYDSGRVSDTAGHWWSPRDHVSEAINPLVLLTSKLVLKQSSVRNCWCLCNILSCAMWKEQRVVILRLDTGSAGKRWGIVPTQMDLCV